MSCAGIGAEIVAQSWLEAGDAYDILARGDAPAIRAALEKTPCLPWTSWCNRAPRRARKKLIVADMDSTMIACECIDELADYAGLKAEVAAITEAADARRAGFCRRPEGPRRAAEGPARRHA